MMRVSEIKGTYTALITPMSGGKVDYEDLKNLVNAQIKGGVTGLIPVGTTGESPTLKAEEHLQVIRAVVEYTNKRVPVIAGTGANSTEEAIELVSEADEAGVDGHLQVCPYYNKPTQQGLMAHFSAIAEATKNPIMLYSIPGRCVIEIAVSTIAALHEKYPHINCIKEAGGRSDRISQIRSALPAESFAILSGDDSLTIPFMSLGASGVVSVASNLFPEKIVEMTQLALNGDFTGARAMHYNLYELLANLFIEANPVPAKYALYKMGRIKSPEVKKPLVELSAESAAILDKTLKQFAI